MSCANKPTVDKYGSQERVFLGKCFTWTTVSANLKEGDNTDHAVQSKLFSREEC